MPGRGCRALVIPVEGPVYELDVPESDGLTVLQIAVGGLIEAVVIPQEFGGDIATAYVDMEGKQQAAPNMRATDFMVPGVGLFMGDHIAGPMVLLGFDRASGEHRDVPMVVEDRARLIEREAG